MVPLGSSQREGTLVKSYTALTQNMFKHLARGEEVQYGAFRVKTVDDKIVVRGVLQDGREMELHYRLRQGKEAGFSKDSLKIFLPSEKNHFLVSIFVPGGQSKQHGTKEEEERGPYLEVWALPREKQALCC